MEFFTENLEILKLENKNGDTVAHIQAYNGWSTKNPEVLKLKNRSGKTVEDIIQNSNN